MDCSIFDDLALACSEGGWHEVDRILLDGLLEKPGDNMHGSGNTVKNRNAPLHFAVYFGRIVAVGALLEAGANPNLLDDHAMTPLHMVMCGWGHWEQDKHISIETRAIILLKMLLNAGGDADRRCDRLEMHEGDVTLTAPTAVGLAAQLGWVSVVAWLLHETRTECPPSLAASDGDRRAVRTILEAGAPVLLGELGAANYDFVMSVVNL